MSKVGKIFKGDKGKDQHEFRCDANPEQSITKEFEMEDSYSFRALRKQVANLRGYD